MQKWPRVMGRLDNQVMESLSVSWLGVDRLAGTWNKGILDSGNWWQGNIGGLKLKRRIHGC